MPLVNSDKEATIWPDTRRIEMKFHDLKDVEYRNPIDQ
jgi:hypothetical protein